MGEAAKYLFDRNFDEPVQTTEPPEVLLERRLREEFEQVLAAARQTEYERGKDDGAREAREAAEAGTNTAVAQLVQQAESILSRLEDECQSIRSAAIRLALTAAEKLAGDLVQREPTALLETMFSDCLQHLTDAPHIAVRVNDALAETLQQKVHEIAARQGFAGKIIVLGDPETHNGDCRIEWADGGITRDFEKLRLEVNEIVKRHVGSSPKSEAAESVGAPADRNNPRPAKDLVDTAAQTNGSGDSV